MAGVLLFPAVAAWITICGWVVEKIGNLFPDRDMRLTIKFLLFVLFTATPLLHRAAKTAESGASSKQSEQHSQQGAVSSSVVTDRGGLQ